MLSYDEFKIIFLGSDDPEVKKVNKKLCEEYPFLLPRYEWTQEPIEDYDYEFTNLDELPMGWRKKFGLDMCEELKQILVDGNCLNDYRVLQIKEKYGILRWYDNGIPTSISERYDKWLKKYEDLSEETCIVCGNPGKMVTRGWISPYCKKCFHNMYPKANYDEWTS